MNQALMMYFLGRVSVILTASLLVPMAYCLYAGASEGIVFLLVFFLMAASTAGLLVEGRVSRRQLSIKEGAQFLLILWCWLAFFGMLPFLETEQLDLVGAMFESVSALTTTGVTLLPADAPYVMWIWRALLGWLGGMAFLVMLVTILPHVSGCFGLTLAFRRSMTFSAMLKPMEHVSLQAMGVYGGITLFSWLLYVLAGLAPLDSMIAAMLTVSTTGGADVLDWFGEDGNPWPECAAALTMALVCGNLLRYWRTFQRKDFGDYYRNPETRAFFAAVFLFGCFVTWNLWYHGLYDFLGSMRQAFFHVLSFASTTGFATAAAVGWPDAALFFLFLLAVVGGCMGSPTGGLKVIRFMVLFKLMGLEVRRTLHPRMLANVMVGRVPVPAKIAQRILGFFFLYAAAFFLFVLLLSLSGISMTEAVGMSLSGFTSLGTSLGLAGEASFTAMPGILKVMACFFMIFARMEIFAVLLLVQLTIGEFRRRW